MHEFITYPEKVANLARKIYEGEILLPAFQREYVWNKDQILTLLDSVYRGFPIGSILLWETSEELRTRKFLDELKIAAGARGHKRTYLLDGQQRLSTLCACLTETAHAERSIWNTALDLSENKFVHVVDYESSGRHQIPTHALANPLAFLRAIKQLEASDAPDAEDMLIRAKAAFEAFSNFSIPVISLKGLDIKTVAPIFERINSTGTELSVADLMRAALWNPTFDFFQRIETELLEPIKDSGFGDIDEDTILRACAAFHGGGFNIDEVNKLRRVSASAMSSVLDRVIRASKRAVDILKHEFRVFDRAMLPYKPQLLFLIVLMGQVKRLDTARMEAVRGWFWRTSFSSHFSGWNTGDMSRDFDRILRFADDADSILHDVDELDLCDVRATNWHMRAAKAKAFRLLLASKHPIDILSGQTIAFERAAFQSNRSEFHHVFPKAFMARNRPRAPMNRLGNIIALSSDSNRAIRDKAPSDYFLSCVERMGAERDRVLASNILNKASVDAILYDDFTAFLEARSALVAEEIGRCCRVPAIDRAA